MPEDIRRQDTRPEDIRKSARRNDPQTGPGGGAAYREGYGPGGLGAGAQPSDPAAQPWDAPGTAPDGRRTGSSTDGRRIPVDGEGEPAEAAERPQSDA